MEKRMEKHEESINNLYLAIIANYKNTKSIKRTAELLDTYPIKVRRVLITEELWESETSKGIGILFKEGLSVKEIARKLFISEKNVQSYLPYTRGQYKNQRTQDSTKSELYRKRMKFAYENQILNKREELTQRASSPSRPVHTYKEKL
jgi:hypothetical protein